MFEAEADVFLACSVFESNHKVVNETYKVCFTEMHLHLSFFNFSYVHKLVYETQYPFCISVNHHVCFACLLIIICCN